MGNKDGGPAFPRQHTVANANDPAFKLGCEGMTLRDWFAGQALAGLLASIKDAEEILNNYAHAANEAWSYADAMIAERERE